MQNIPIISGASLEGEAHNSLQAYFNPGVAPDDIAGVPAKTRPDAAAGVYGAISWRLRWCSGALAGLEGVIIGHANVVIFPRGHQSHAGLRAVFALVVGVLPNLPDFFKAAGFVESVAPIFELLYTCAWFVGLTVSAVVHGALMYLLATLIVPCAS